MSFERVDLSGEPVPDPIVWAMRRGSAVIMDEYAEHNVWDLLPALYLVVQIDGAELLPEDAAEFLADDPEARAMAVRFQHLEIPDEAWEGAHPTDVLSVLTEFMRTEMGPYPVRAGERAIGLMFISEGWGHPQSATADVQELARNRKLHTLPDRVELRMVSAVDTAGYRYLTARERGAQENSAELVSGPGTTGMVPGGAVLDELEAMLAVVVGEPDTSAL